MRNLTYSLLFITLFSCAVMGQGYRSENLGAPTFTETFGFFPGEKPPNARVEVYLKIPYGGLQFPKCGDTFRAGFTAAFAIYDGKKMIAKSDRTDSVEVDSYSSTHSPSFVRPEPYFLDNIPAGRYKLLISLTDRETGAGFSHTAEIVVPGFSKKDLPEFSSVILNVEETDDRSPDRDSTGGNVERLVFKLEILLPDSIRGFIVRGIEADGVAIVAETLQIVEAGVKMELDGELPLPDSDAELTFFAEVVSEGKILVRTEKDVELPSEWFDRTASSPEEAIAQLDLIGSREEMKKLENALENTPERLDSLIEYFWGERDPTPATKINEVREEFYRRVFAANERFGPFTPGWKTDMGEVFIIYGEPDEIDRHPFDSGYRAYEIWYYFSPRKTFYFEDTIGDGTYRLVRRE